MRSEIALDVGDQSRAIGVVAEGSVRIELSVFTACAA